MRGRWSRGYLTHIDCGREPQFITFRLDDSLPREVYQKWIEELRHCDDATTRRELASRTEKYLDAGHGSCILKNPVAAIIVQEALLFVHGRKCEMHCWCVMPNHVHLVMTPFDGVSVGKVMGPLKGFCAHEIHAKLGGESGRLWQPESYDRVVRDAAHFERVVKYIERNPVKARLCGRAEDWPYSTANPSVLERLGAAKN